jgi:LysM repeat protein
VVKEGEDLYGVAIRWGVSPGDLKMLNNLITPNLKAGQILKLPHGYVEDGK